MGFQAIQRSVTRSGHTYLVWDEYPHVKDWDFWTVFENDEWEPGLDEILDERLTPAGTVLDVGAWIGPVALMAASRCGNVHAVEPDPVARRWLDANADLNPLAGITVWPVALAAVDGPVRIGHRDDRRFGDSMTSMIFDNGVMEVPGVTLGGLLADAHVTSLDLIKIDIEGGEETVLPACADTIRELGAPLLLSLHTAIVPDPDRYLTAIRTALGGFDTTVLSGDWNGLGTVLAVPR